MFDPQIIFVIVGGLVAGVVIRRLWSGRKNATEERLREIERAAIEESNREEKREQRAAGGQRSRKRSRQKQQSQSRPT